MVHWLHRRGQQLLLAKVKNADWQDWYICMKKISTQKARKDGDEASPWTSWCRIYKKLHLRSCHVKVWWLLTTQLLKIYPSCHYALLAPMNHLKSGERAILDFNRNLPTHCGKTSLRAFLSWVNGMALNYIPICYTTDTQNVVCQTTRGSSI